ncbi:hypothetical protein DFH29DRAFT_1006512 [Suillus ampliporus]|nr:hypothetical protein DFH29DRAFT_1006512 [Suillus ampliporus]
MPGSSSKAKKMKRKALDSDPKTLEGQAGSGKRSRAQASLQPPTDVNDSQPRCSGRSGAGKGGRGAQLEKIGAILDAPARTSQPKGTTSLTSNFPLNPLAPEPSRKGHGSRSKIKQPPPPYTISETLDSSTTTSRPRPKKIKKTVTPSLSLEASNYQPAFIQRDVGGRYGFAPPIVPPGTEPDLQALNNSFVAAAKGVSEQRALSASHDSCLVAANALERRLPAAASSNLSQRVLLEPSIVNLSGAHFHENLDPTLQPINHGDQRNLGPQGTDSERSDASMESSDVEDTSDGDEDSADRQIGWGEAGGRHDAHPGFSEEVQLSQPRVAIALPSDFEFQHSRDEDDHAAGRSLAFSDVSSSDDSETDAPQPADVLQLHHQKNGHPHLPDPALLDLLNGAETVNKPGSMKATKASKDPGDGPKSTQLAWYGPHWKHFLEEAKGECRALHALENAFPKLVPDLSTTVTESLSASLVEWLKDGNQVEADVWPARKPDMARLVCISLVSSPSLLPCTVSSTQERANWVEAAAANLLDKSAYLRDGKDELGKTRNFAHPALREATILFLYVGSYRIAHRRPDVFRKQDYLPIYNGMLELLNDKLMKDPYHSPKLVWQLHKWAEAGWVQSCKLDSNNTSKHTHLQIELD